MYISAIWTLQSIIGFLDLDRYRSFPYSDVKARGGIVTQAANPTVLPPASANAMSHAAARSSKQFLSSIASRWFKIHAKG